MILQLVHTTVSVATTGDCLILNVNVIGTTESTIYNGEGDRIGEERKGCGCGESGILEGVRLKGNSATTN